MVNDNVYNEWTESWSLDSVAFGPCGGAKRDVLARSIRLLANARRNGNAFRVSSHQGNAFFDYFLHNHQKSLSNRMCMACQGEGYIVWEDGSWCRGDFSMTCCGMSCGAKQHLFNGHAIMGMGWPGPKRWKVRWDGQDWVDGGGCLRKDDGVSPVQG